MIQARIVAVVIGLLMPLLIGLGLVLFVVLLAVSASSQDSANQYDLCEPSWSGEGISEHQLTQDQLDAAATIYTVAMETGAGSRGAIVAIATAMQESTLGAHPSITTPNSDGDVGLFQQRAKPGWYADGETIEENTTILNDYSYAARTFFVGHDVTVAADGGNPVGYHIPGLLDISGWEEMPVARAAQSVQVSAFPDAYAQHESLAQSLVSTLSGGEAGPIICGPAPGPLGECPVFDARLEAGLSADAIRVLRCTKAAWPQIVSWSVLRPGDPRDHGQGRAVDVMIPDYRSSTGISLGTDIAEHFRANASAYGVTYVIWREQIWSVARADEGWRSCATGSCYSGPDDSAAHRDHVHVSVHGNAGTGVDDGVENPSSVTAVTPVQKGQYQLTARFNQRGSAWSSGFHTGLDFAAPTGTPIVAPVSGTVTSVGWGGPYGNLTKIRVDESTELYFAHQSATNVFQGMPVLAGQRIGDVGNTGNSYGSHLHFEVRVNGVAVDPDVWLTQRGAKP